MTHILSNENIQLFIDLPQQNYNAARFDWTGKIRAVKFKNTPISSVEILNAENTNEIGSGFYNEFGINMPIGFNEIEIGDWFHKIGIGLLKKTDNDYLFSKKYEIKPAAFEISPQANRLIINCHGTAHNGYAYTLNKEIKLHKNGFVIKYNLHNAGDKNIITNEYTHNFLAINQELIDANYILKFPFDIKPERFEITVNPENKVDIKHREICFRSTPSEPFFFSNLSGSESVEGSWELINKKCKLGIREKTNFSTSKINLWGSKHVVSPELFIDIFVKPNESQTWSRTYQIFELD